MITETSPQVIISSEIKMLCVVHSTKGEVYVLFADRSPSDLEWAIIQAAQVLETIPPDDPAEFEAVEFTNPRGGVQPHNFSIFNRKPAEEGLSGQLAELDAYLVPPAQVRLILESAGDRCRFV